MRSFCTLTLLLFLAYAHTHAQVPTREIIDDPNTGARSHNIDQQRMVVSLSIIPEDGLVIGNVKHIFAPLRSSIDSLFLDAPEIDIHAVMLNGQRVEYSISDEGVTVYPPHPLVWDQIDTLSINYEARPRHGMYFVGWNDPTGRARRQIWTQGQGPGHRYWVPIYDYPNDKLITETIVTFDEDYEVLSNGELVEVVDNPDTTRTWHYRMPSRHAPYLMMLAIGRYSIQRMISDSGVPLNLYYYPDLPERAEPTYRFSARMMDFLEDELGVRYPWGSYSQVPVSDYLHGGMENTTATVFTDAYLVDERAFLDQNYVNVNGHELAHQWFGDLVTQARNEDIWLHESFATYYAKLVERDIFGEDHYQWVRKVERDHALSEPERGPIPIRGTLSGGALVYRKGSLVLDMLRDVVGDDEFKRSIRRYLEEHAYGNVAGPDFFSTFDEVLGQNLDWFFDQWIKRGGAPHYQVSYGVRTEDNETFTEFTVEQLQDTSALIGVFRMPIGFEVHYRDGSSSAVRAFVDSAKAVVRVPNSEKKSVDFTLFDPGHRLVKRLTFSRSIADLRAQALRAQNMIDRYDAVVALDTVSIERKRSILHEVYFAEESPHIRAEAIRQLVNDGNSLSQLRQALADPDPVVRRTVLTGVPAIFPQLKPGFERALEDPSYINVATALLRLGIENPEGGSAYLDRTATIEGHDHNVRAVWLELAARSGNLDAVDELIDLSGRSFGFRTRLNAFTALERLRIVDARVAAHLLDAMSHFNRRLRTPAIALFERFSENKAFETHARTAYQARHWTEQERRRIEKYVQDEL